MGLGGFGFLAGGAAQGLTQGMNSARQSAIEQAYLKLQQSREAFTERQQQENQALSPLQRILTPETAANVLPAFSKAKEFAANPEGFSYTPPGEDRASAEDELAPRAPVTGAPGYSAYLGDVGKGAREATIDAEARKFARSMILMQAQIQAAASRAALTTHEKNTQNAADAASIEAAAAARTRGTHTGAAPFIGPEAAARATGAGIGSGKLVPPDGLPTDNLGVSPVPPPARSAPVTRRPTAKERSDIDALLNYYDSALSLKQAVESGKLPDMGTVRSKTNQALAAAGSVFGQTWDDPRLTATQKWLLSNMFERMKLVGGVRMAGSPVEFRLAQQAFPNPGQSRGGLAAVARNAFTGAEKMRQNAIETLSAAGVDPSVLSKHTPKVMSPEEIMGMPGAGPAGQVTLPGKKAAPLPGKSEDEFMRGLGAMPLQVPGQ